ncbi:alanine racemase [Prosthecochloris sp. GSB1]|uniref:alanine racemase n=1 Tax=Prosthecochloris sp. GSB1 TaxID=281093 RepID=UPI001EEEB520|nr:alanine racemase [Prosthecochloris sp. GSB1]
MATAIQTVENAGAGPEEHLAEALVSIGNLAHNYRCVRQRVGDACRVMGIVKANAYGHGAEHVSKALEGLGVRDFGVANIEEAIRLRSRGGISGNSAILAFCPPLPSHVPLFLRHDVDATVCNFDTLRSAESIAGAENKQLRVHVKVDTGMGRLGSAPANALQLLRAVDESPSLLLAGVYTHFAQSTLADTFAQNQLDSFKHVCAEFEHHAGRRVCKHAANSGAILGRTDSFLDMVRPGIMLYGYTPDEHTPCHTGLRPVMQLQARVIFVKEVPAGTTVSYNRTWTAPSKRLIATISAGYADGYHRALSNRAAVVIRGKRYRQAGTVTMDQIMVDLGNDSDVRVGDPAVLFGWDGPSAADLAKEAGTISYELLCAVSPRVVRSVV